MLFFVDVSNNWLLYADLKRRVDVMVGVSAVHFVSFLSDFSFFHFSAFKLFTAINTTNAKCSTVETKTPGKQLK